MWKMSDPKLNITVELGSQTTIQILRMKRKMTVKIKDWRNRTYERWSRVALHQGPQPGADDHPPTQQQCSRPLEPLVYRLHLVRCRRTKAALLDYIIEHSMSSIFMAIFVCCEIFVVSRSRHLKSKSHLFLIKAEFTWRNKERTVNEYGLQSCIKIFSIEPLRSVVLKKNSTLVYAAALLTRAGNGNSRLLPFSKWTPSLIWKVLIYSTKVEAITEICSEVIWAGMQSIF